MALFLGVHKLGEGMSEEDVANGWNTYKQSATSKGLKPLGAVVSMEKGFAYCQTEAQSADQVREAHQAVEIPLEDVIEVKPLS
ncbi:DUF4242 domain-containing protein [Candidatus Microgenomates bacterium]|nr:DUF4242 domain-containing protein [Candidatus Microgenomates bacterium]